jgi:uncharacterized delta-60 repeat protein
MRRVVRAAAAAAATTLALATLSGAGAATSSTVVTATVASATEIHPAACASGTPNVTQIGVLLPGSSATTTADCTVTFGSSNDSSQLRLSQQDGGRQAMYGPSTGVLDPTFGTGGVVDLSGVSNAGYFDVIPYPGGGWVVGGEADPGPTFQLQVTRLSELGATVWSNNITIPGSDDSMVFDLDVDAAGRIVLAGHSEPGGVDRDSIVMRLLSSGVEDVSFNASGTPGRLALGGAGQQAFKAVGVQSGDRIVTGGFDYSDGDAKLYRILASGAIDSTFGTSGFTRITGADDTHISGVEVLDDDSIIVVGYMQRGASTDTFVVKVDADGVIDNTWGGGLQWIDTDIGVPDTYDALLQLDHDPNTELTWLVATDDSGADSDTLVARFDAGGVLDTSFGGGTGIVTYDAVGGHDELGDGIVAAVDGTAYVSTHRSSNGVVYVRHLEADGAQDMRFAGDGDLNGASGTTNNQYRTHLAMDTDGRVAGVAVDQVFRVSAPSVPDFASGPADWDDAGGMFGACLRAVSGGAATDGTTWQVDGANDCAATNGDTWNPIVATSVTAGSKIAYRATPGTGTVALRFGMRAPAATPPGEYVAPIRFDVLAPNAP